MRLYAIPDQRAIEGELVHLFRVGRDPIPRKESFNLCSGSCCETLTRCWIVNQGRPCNGEILVICRTYKSSAHLIVDELRNSTNASRQQCATGRHCLEPGKAGRFNQAG